MRHILFAWTIGALAACGSSDSLLGSSNRKVGDAALGAGGAGTGGRGTGAAVQGSGGVQTGCRSDVECKGSRICVNGQCVDPLGAGGLRGSGGLPQSGGAGGVPLGGAGGLVFGGAGGFIPDASAGAQPGAGGSQCAAISLRPESVVVYRDSSVTDTIVMVKPVALFLMIDRSSSMVAANSQNWNDATAAVTAFVNDPLSQGIDIGLGTFPYGPSNTAACDGSDCGVPVVQIASLPGNAIAMQQAMQAQKPSPSSGAGTPTECGLRGVLNHCLTFMASSSTGEQCVAVLITDGAPTACDTNSNYLEQIVSEGHSRGVTTYAIGVAGADMGALNGLANAGGTSKAIDVSGGAQAFIQALNDIAKAVSVRTSTVVTTPVVVATSLPCEWMVPLPPLGQTLDPAKVNLQLQLPGSPSETVGFVSSGADCFGVTGDAWYYDNAQNPTRIRLCPNACQRVVTSSQASVSVLLGCDTRRAM